MMEKPPKPDKLNQSRNNSGIVSHFLMELESSDYQLYPVIAHLHEVSRVCLYGHSLINKTFTLFNYIISTAVVDVI